MILLDVGDSTGFEIVRPPFMVASVLMSRFANAELAEALRSCDGFGAVGVDGEDSFRVEWWFSESPLLGRSTTCCDAPAGGTMGPGSSPRS